MVDRYVFVFVLTYLFSRTNDMQVRYMKTYVRIERMATVCRDFKYCVVSNYVRYWHITPKPDVQQKL